MRDDHDRTTDDEAAAPGPPTPLHTPPRHLAPEQRGCFIAPEAVWSAVREDYLAGVSAPECCRRHGVGLTALRRRASQEGWRRADQAWVPPNRLDPWDEGVALEEQVHGDLDRIEMRQLGYVACCRMMRAVLRGDAAEALRWRRVRDAMDFDAAEDARRMEAEDAEDLRRRHAAARAARPAGAHDPNDPDDPDDLDGWDGVSPHPDDPGAPTP